MVARVIADVRKRLNGRRLLLVVLVLGITVGGLAAIAERPTYYTSLTIGSRQYKVRVAATEASREQGLSGTKSLPADEGMLFVFDKDDLWAIWMKDMNYPIDILWLDQSKTVTDIVSRASPASYPSVTFKPKQPARYVIELPAGSIPDASAVVGSRATFDVKQLGGAKE